MLRTFLVVVTCFFAFEVFIHGFLPLTSGFGSEDFEKVLTMSHQAFEFSVNVTILAIFRPREWPAYFNINLGDDRDAQFEFQ